MEAIRKLQSAVNLAEHRALQWAEYDDIGTVNLDEFYESDEDEASTMADITRHDVDEANRLLETPKPSKHSGQRYCHPKVLPEIIVHNVVDIWEALLDNDALYDWFTWGLGRNEGVQIAMTVAPRIQIAYELVESDFHEPFDLEFVPALLSAMLAYGIKYKMPAYEIPQDVLNGIAHAITWQTEVRS
jgi:hypothetical protein